MAKQVLRIRDFTAGQIDIEALRRDDAEIQRAGCREFQNMRPLGVGAARQRPGRQALFSATGRTETVRVGVAGTFRLNFASGVIRVYNLTGSLLATDTGRPWGGTLADLALIRFAVIGNDIVVTYPGNRPRVASRASAGSWSFSAWAFDTGLNGRSLEPFYRYAAAGITMLPSALTGSGITLTFSASVLTAAHVGAVFRYQGKQVRLTGYTNGTTGTGTVLEPLPPSREVKIGSLEGFEVGQVVEGIDSGCKAVVMSLNTGNTSLYVIVTNNYGSNFIVDEQCVGPNGKSKVVNVGSIAIQATTVWDESLMSDARGWPRGVSYGFNRLMFFDVEGEADAWACSRIGVPADMEVGADADDGFTEIVPGKARVVNVVPGADVFVFTDRRIFYVPVSEGNPLKPGSAAFREIGRDGCAAIRPVETADGVLYVNAGLTRVMSVIGTGQAARPYILQDITQYHSAVLSTPVCLAATTGDGTIPERYVYAVNTDGTMAVGRVDIDRKMVGWQPWTGSGSVFWVSADGSEVLFSTVYGSRSLVETLDDAVFLDAQITYNAAPAALAPGLGQGPLWFLAGQTVSLMIGDRDLGDRVVDGNGYLTALSPDDDFTPAALVCGFAWETRVTPFVPTAPEGQSARQGLRRRRIARAAVTVVSSVTNYEFMSRYVGPYRWGDDQGAAPPRRTETRTFIGLGRDFDPERPLVRTRPGPFTLAEITMEVSV